jgi:hypothetical protein
VGARSSTDGNDVVVTSGELGASADYDQAGGRERRGGSLAVIDDHGDLVSQITTLEGESLAVDVAPPDDSAVVAAEMNALLGFGGQVVVGMCLQVGDDVGDQGDVGQLGVRAGDKGL